jgi:LuxR family transcriptional regulator, maltose regulon positive regulatory protein
MADALGAGIPHAGFGPSLHWYTIDPADRDLGQFLAYLAGSLGLDLPHAVGDGRAAGGEWANAIDTLANQLQDALVGPALLALDDFHFVADVPEITTALERFLSYLPPQLHVIIASRHAPALAPLAAWRARGELLEVGRRDLAFREDEVAALFETVYAAGLAAPELAALAHLTEGWPIALQLAWQGLRSQPHEAVENLLAIGNPSSEALFDFLAHELLERQPPEIRRFLLDTAVLRELTPAACDAVRGTAVESEGLLYQVHELDLFTVAVGEPRANGLRYRYHHLFHDFLRVCGATDPEGVRNRHRRAASYYERAGDGDEAVHHWLASGSFDEAARAIEAAGERNLAAGRLEVVAGWIDVLPPTTVADRPRLQALQGDVCRLHSRFDEALAWYSQAEETARGQGDSSAAVKALHGSAAVYLDTVRPAQAENLLLAALRLCEGITDRRGRARMLELLAENKLNIGKPAEAETLRKEAAELRDEGPAEDTLSLRVKLRTGQLAEARRGLEAQVEAERRAARTGQVGPPRAHRESLLILALIDAFQGRAEPAFALATEGIELGERLGSPFVTAVGQMRLGHAWQVASPELRDRWRGGSPRSARDQAIQCYQAAIALGDRMDVRRTGAEAMWGLTRAYGFFPAAEGAGAGDLAAAERSAAEGIELARSAGDAWVVALTRLALGGSYILAERHAAGLECLSAALAAFRDVGDTFGRAAARLWQALALHALRQRQQLAPILDELLSLCETNGYDYLLTSTTFLGPPEPRRIVPLLLQAREKRVQTAYVARLLAIAGLPEIQVHPGYQLRVRTLGAFRVWRGESEVAQREWQRDKARQLFQLLLTERGRWLQRDEIVDRLWPSLGPDAAIRDFKVALNALNKAVEPAHAAEDSFAFVAREGTAYRLRAEADLSLDAAEFERHCEAGLRGPLTGAGSDDTLARLRAAMALYGGDYLPEALYEDWAAETRERLLTLYLRAADRLASALIDRGQYEEALNACQAILARDACWERAYRLMMKAYTAQGNRPQAMRAYQRCVDVLRDQLDVEPSPETVALERAIEGAQLQ